MSISSPKVRTEDNCTTAGVARARVARVAGIAAVVYMQDHTQAPTRKQLGHLRCAARAPPERGESWVVNVEREEF